VRKAAGAAPALWRRLPKAACSPMPTAAGTAPVVCVRLGTCSLQMPAYQSLACVGRRLLCFLLRTFYTRCNGKCVVVGAGPALLAYKAPGSRS